ncbi:hypothetical protein L596_026358 [Steinernema carpocapsae]|uniref:Uncharacterized protein n=1 Tax=Steinernema carpocapsae TaxID=34508 RepID=A0A4U5M140_STECR|nr:hypothetical protein L596_026358 [Steinernema carpocapsae]
MSATRIRSADRQPDVRPHTNTRDEMGQSTEARKWTNKRMDAVGTGNGETGNCYKVVWKTNTIANSFYAHNRTIKNTLNPPNTLRKRTSRRGRRLQSAKQTNSGTGGRKIPVCTPVLVGTRNS